MLLGACRDAGARIVAFSDSDVAVAGYRGGEPHLDRRLAAALGVQIAELGRVYDTSRAVRELARQACARIAQSGSPARRGAQVADDAPEGALVTHLGATPSQMGALIARALRSRHLHDGIDFSDQVVIVRSSSMVAETRRYLARGGVPLAGRRPCLRLRVTAHDAPPPGPRDSFRRGTVTRTRPSAANWPSVLCRRRSWGRTP